MAVEHQKLHLVKLLPATTVRTIPGALLAASPPLVVGPAQALPHVPHLLACRAHEAGMREEDTWHTSINWHHCPPRPATGTHFASAVCHIASHQPRQPPQRCSQCLQPFWEGQQGTQCCARAKCCDVKWCSEPLLHLVPCREHRQAQVGVIGLGIDADCQTLVILFVCLGLGSGPQSAVVVVCCCSAAVLLPAHLASCCLLPA